jgi:hypothetical protein
VRRFELIRHADETGISGTGLVAEGVEFGNGRVAMRWCASGRPGSVVIWDSTADAMHIHGHDGRTELRWADE